MLCFRFIGRVLKVDSKRCVRNVIEKDCLLFNEMQKKLDENFFGSFNETIRRNDF